MGVSVVICCYNSSQRLPDTLRHIVAQRKVPGIDWEVILVDNASTDDTIKVAERFLAQLPLVIVQERQQGLSFAREAGVNKAKYDIIVFCDDDNWLTPDYVQTAYDIMQSDTKIGICGGVGEAVFETTAPDWFEKYKMVFACGEQFDYEGELGMNHLSVYGAGMVVRKELYARLKSYNYTFLLTGRKGNKIIAGEDYELGILARAFGYKLYYSRKLRFQHYMPAARMQWHYLVKTVHGSALSSAIIYIYADSLRYHLTGNKRYKVSWLKDIAKAIYGSFLIKVNKPRDLSVVWARLRGSVSSVLKNIGNYRRYEQKIKRLYEDAHKGV